MSKRNINKQLLIEEFGYDFGVDRELKRLSKDKWKLKAAKIDRRKKKGR